MEAQSVTISLHDESRGYEISPDRVPLAVLKDFSNDVEQFLRGDGKQLDTDFCSDDDDQWVRVERYLWGEIYDVGGKQVVNTHMLLPDGKTIKVETNRETIRGDKLNRLYKPAMVRIKADYNVVTREYRNAQLLKFVEHDSKLDEQAMARLTGHGAIAWKDVPNASQWVDNLRSAG